MTRTHRHSRSLAAFAVASLAFLANPSAQEPLKFARSIELPRVDGRIDHLAYDGVSKRLFVAALGNNTVEVVDVATGAHLRSLPDFREPQGIAVAADANVIAIANGQGSGVTLVNPIDFHPVRSVALGDDSDNVRYDAAAKRLYVGYGGGAIAAVDPARGAVLGQVKLAGHPESFQLERSGSRIFVNVPNAGHVAVIDRAAMTVLATWPTTGAGANFPMALDEANHRLFVGCRRPAKVLVFDTTSGQVAASFAIVGDTDDLFYDAARKRLYVSGGEGFVDAFQCEPGRDCARTGRIPTAAGARTSLFVPDLNRLYLAVPHRGSQRAEIREYEAR